MAAVLLFWNTNMAAVTSCENALFEGGRLLGFPLKGTREWSSCSRGIYQERRNRRKIKRRDNAHEGALQAHGYRKTGSDCLNNFVRVCSM